VISFHNPAHGCAVSGFEPLVLAWGGIVKRVLAVSLLTIKPWC
jgi:hypothetical protein